MINTVLGIETSCDETAVAILNDKKDIIFHELWTQDHKRYGGVFPEYAARAHVVKLQSIIRKSFEVFCPEDLSAIAATAGPGLIGGLVVGTTFAKALSFVLNKPFIAINHLEGHALVVRFSHNIEFPFLLILISGGHSEISIVHQVGRYTKLGGSIDDSLGESFDKIAKMMGLPYPGGPIIEKMAKFGNKNRFTFPLSLCRNFSLDFSFSGLKTAVFNTINKLGKLNEEDICDISASFQDCVANILIYKLKASFAFIRKFHPECKLIVISGGVASNNYIRTIMQNFAYDNGFDFIAPPINLCTDNGIMIAWAGIERFKLGLLNDILFEPDPRWKMYE